MERNTWIFFFNKIFSDWITVQSQILSIQIAGYNKSKVFQKLECERIGGVDRVKGMDRLLKQ